MASERYDRRVIEPDGLVHAGRFDGALDSLITACVIYPYPPAFGTEVRRDRVVTCRECQRALSPERGAAR
ncbi:hypothetical protein [Streptomyces sp. NPDC050355]|uniref:hypothetical protein n=1 Tax=Streptomyces sp. NPDC050355 TaxID=3365609 RepID=UPI0037A4956C